MPIRLRDIGNTVSCTLPILIHDLRESDELKAGMESLLIGFGVGSLAGVYGEKRLGVRNAMSDELATCLIASPFLDDPNFFRTVILMIAKGEEGAMGLVLNRPTQSLLTDVLPL